MSKIILFIVVFLLVCLEGSAQGIKRQSIGTLGASYTSKSLTVQQSVGQAYQTKKSLSSVNIGFIQPVKYSVKTIHTTFTKSINAYPNPATNYVSFVTDVRGEEMDIKVFDQTGKMLHSETLNNLNTYKLNCSPWVNGLYLVVITDTKGNIYRSKFIKTK